MIPHCVLPKLLILTLCSSRDHNNYRFAEHLPKIHAAVFAMPIVSAGVTAILEAIAATTSALLAAKAAYNWHEIKRLEKELKELEDALDEETVSQDDDNDDSEDPGGGGGDDEDDEPKTVEDILADTTPGDATKGKAKQYIKNGDFGDAVEDFYSLKPTDITAITNGKMGKLPDGRVVNVRTKSSYDTPTLEIYDPPTGKSIKIRYVG